MRKLRPVFLVLAFLAACAPPPDDVPTARVERRDFRHQVTAEGTLAAVKVTAITVPPEARERMRLAWLADEGYVEEGDIIARFDPKTLQNRLEEGMRERKSTDFEVRKTELDSRQKETQHETDYQVADLELNHARRFQKTDTSAYSRQEIVEDAIDEELAVEKKGHAEFSRTSQAGLAQTEMDLLDIRRRKAELKIDQAQQALQALEVKAPHAGLLSIRRSWNGEPLSVGSEMWAGQEIAEIPNLEVLEAQVYVLEADAGGLEIGKRAEVVLEATPGKTYGGKIYQVDPVAQPRFRGSPVQYFGVKIELDDGATIIKRPGQRLRATIFLAEAKDALVVPRQAVFSEGDEDRVFVRNGDGYESRQVTVNARSMGHAVIDSGLEAGDVVALREPPDRGMDDGADLVADNDAQ